MAHDKKLTKFSWYSTTILAVCIGWLGRDQVTNTYSPLTPFVGFTLVITLGIMAMQAVFWKRNRRIVTGPRYADCDKCGGSGMYYSTTEPDCDCMPPQKGPDFVEDPKTSQAIRDRVKLRFHKGG